MTYSYCDTLTPMIYLPTTNDKRQSGINKLSEANGALSLGLHEFDAVFDREFTSDVHFMTYGVMEDGEMTTSPFPRINKPCLASIQEAGGDVMTVAIVMDFDLKDQPGTEDLPLSEDGKPTWTVAALDAFIRAMPSIDSELSGRKIATPLVYTTAHGARFVHKLASPVPVMQSEDLIRGLMKVYKDLDLHMDPACADWTRLFRAPKVVRGGTRQWEQRWFWVRSGKGTTNPDAIDPVTKQSTYNDKYAGIETINTSRPTPEMSIARLYVGNGGTQRKTEKHKLAQRIMRGTECYPPMFEGSALADEGGRDNALMRMVGQACNFLLGPMSGEFDFEAEDIYALFHDAVEQLEPDSGTPDWLESLWGKVKRCVEREKAKLKFQDQTKDEQREQVATEARGMLQIVRETCELAEIHDQDEVTAQAALRRLLLICEPSGRFRALKVDGNYSDTPVPQSRLHNLVRTTDLELQIPLWCEDDKGKPKQVSEQTLARMATDVARIVGASGVSRTHVSGDSWDNLTLRMKLYARSSKLEPTYSNLVDEWLEILTKNPAELRRWLSRALEFEGGPICALSLAGAAGAGKGMLAQGLVETLEHPQRADKSCLVTRFNESLRYTPFLIVDEGLPRGTHDIADMFRALTGGEPTMTEGKFQTPIEIRNPMRILFTANNLDVVQQLASHRVNDSRDQAALAIRLLHLDVQETSEMHLRAKGGLEYTRGWVEGADGSPSDFVVAKHLLWLYENRDQYGERDKRLLVEGRADTEVVQSLRIAGSVPEAIARAIITGLEMAAQPSVKDGIAIDGDRLLVMARAVEEQHRQLNENHVQLTAGRIGKAMRNMCSPGIDGADKSRRENLNGNITQQRWWDVDVKLLWRYAQDAGYKRDKLERLVVAQYGLGSTDE